MTTSFTTKSLEVFLGRKFIHVSEVATELGITPQAIIELSLTEKIPLYVMKEKGWKFCVVTGEPRIYNKEYEDIPAYELLKLYNDDISMLYANGAADISDFTGEDGCHIRWLSLPVNNEIAPTKTVTITISKLIVMFDDLIASTTPSQLGESEKENLLKTIAALAYTTSYFYEKAFEDGKLGQSPKINVSQLVDEVHKHLSENGFTVKGIAHSSVESRISNGMKLLKKE